MTAAMWRVSLRKELRALLPMWAACMLGVCAVAAWGDQFLRPFAVMLYGLGSIALGAHAMGHEYANHTIGLLLSHPVDRRALLLVKVMVLLPLLAVLGILALSTVLRPDSFSADVLGISVRIAILVLLSALCLAPTLTLLCRNAIAGVVFTAGIAGGLQATSELVGSGGVADAWLWYSMLMACALGALVGWRQFTRLEALDGGGPDLQLPRFAGSSAITGASARSPRNPIASLVAKELRLQQLTFVVAGMCLAGILWVTARRRFDYNVIEVVTLLCAAALPLLIGSLASAEERRMGTLQWQQLMPVSTRAQFAVKLAVVFALALGLSMGLAALSVWLVGLDTHVRDWVSGVTGIVLVTSASLYLSSLSASGIRAAMTALPTMMMTLVLFRYLGDWFFTHLVRLYAASPEWRPYLEWMFGRPSSELLTTSVAVVGVCAVLLGFAHHNHTSAEQPREHIRRQGGWLAATMLSAWLLLIAGRVL